MDEKKMKILQMVEDKIITVEEAMNLLALLENRENKNKDELTKEERKQHKELVKKIKKEGKAKKYSDKYWDGNKYDDNYWDEEVKENTNRAEIVKLSEGEFEVLPKEPKPGAKLQKRGWFGGKLFGGGRKLVIRVEEKGKAVVNLRLPLGFMAPFIKGGIKMGKMSSPEFSQYMSQIDPAELERYINSGYTGALIDIHDEEDGEHVYIGIE